MYHLTTDGFSIADQVFSNTQVDQIVKTIGQHESERPTFRRGASLFAIRQFMKELPELCPMIFTEELNSRLTDQAGTGYELVKSIYFDKPGNSNWFVSYHQDLTISVKEKGEYPGFGPWTAKHEQFAVQPPLPILEDNVTLRIHLDTTTADNGALRVIPQSHKLGIVRYNADTIVAQEVICPVSRGGVMFMKPLLLHSSGRTTNNASRRVIHLEFSRCVLPEGMWWSEKS